MNMTAYRTFSPDQIRAIREGLGLDQTQFGRLLGVLQGTVSNWEQGARNPSGSACILLESLEKRAAEKLRQNAKKCR